MKLQTFMRAATIIALAGAGMPFLSEGVCAQVMDFSKVEDFESMGMGTLRGGSPPKTIVDDNERHVVFITIWESDTDTKAYWKPLDGSVPRTTIISGPAAQAFQTAGEFRLEALGDENHSVKYGYLLLLLRE